MKMMYEGAAQNVKDDITVRATEWQCLDIPLHTHTHTHTHTAPVQEEEHVPHYRPATARVHEHITLFCMQYNLELHLLVKATEEIH